MVGKYVKVVYQDDNTNKVIRGELQKEDDYFLYILDNELENRISKKVVISMKECLEDCKNGKSNFN